VTGAAFRRLDARVAVSEEARRSIAHYFPAAYEVVSNGVDAARFHPAVAPIEPRDPARPTVLFVGRADPRKGLPILRAAFEEVRRRVPAARLVAVGPDGYVAPDLLPRYYAACDVFCSPATGGESQGIVLLEAMASGRPVVASHIAGYRDVVAPGRTGLLVPPGDAAALADAIVRLLEEPRQRAAIGAAARAAALAYAWPSVVDRLEAIFAAAVGSRAV
jgi:phosphatidylinositol alpha-mannosyltransferase